MRRYLYNILKFAGFTVSFYILYVIIGGITAPRLSGVPYNRGETGHIYTRLKEIETIDSIDILFLGNSTAYRNFDPRIFQKHNIKIFVLGSSSQTPIQTEVLLKRYLKNISPKYVVYAVSNMIFSSNGLESAIDINSNDQIDYNSLKMATTINHPRLYNSLIFSTFKEFLNEPYTEPLVKDGELYISGGFVESDVCFYKKESEIEVEMPKEFNKKQLKSFNNIIEILEQEKIKYTLISIPFVSKYNFEENNNSEFQSFISNYNYYNLSNVEMNDTLHFYDNFHLNQIGVEHFNEIFINEFYNKKIKRE